MPLGIIYKPTEFNQEWILIAELLSAEGARAEHPFLRKYDKPINPRKFGYDVTVRESVRSDSGGGGGESQGNPNGGVQEAVLLCQQTMAE